MNAGNGQGTEGEGGTPQDTKMEVQVGTISAVTVPSNGTNSSNGLPPNGASGSSNNSNPTDSGSSEELNDFITRFLTGIFHDIGRRVALRTAQHRPLNIKIEFDARRPRLPLVTMSCRCNSGQLSSHLKSLHLENGVHFVVVDRAIVRRFVTKGDADQHVVRIDRRLLFDENGQLLSR